MKIFKYPLQIVDEQIVEIPNYKSILSVQSQKDSLVLYALVEEELKPPTRKIRVFIIGTGNPITRLLSAYLGTIQQNNGDLVWHVFGELVNDNADNPL